MNKYAEYVKEKLTERELLEQLAEEAAELSQAALKLIRARGYSNNVTPLREWDAAANLFEEVQDVAAVIYLLDDYGLNSAVDGVDDYWKWGRWAGRLGYKKDE